jgi:RNA polymerase sigma-70 factor (ECF subfamily)
MYVSYTDEHLLKLAAEGDNDALVELKHRHDPQLLGFINKMLLDKSADEDVLQGTWQKALKFHEQLNPQKGSFNTWIMVMAKNLAVSDNRSTKVHRRHYKPMPDGFLEHESTKEVEAPETVAERHQQMELVRAAMQTLPDEDRAILTQFHINDRSQSEIAKEYGVTEELVRQRALRARKRLKNAILKGSA